MKNLMEQIFPAVVVVIIFVALILIFSGMLSTGGTVDNSFNSLIDESFKKATVSSGLIVHLY